MIRLLIAENSGEYRSALNTFLKQHPSIQIVGVAGNLLDTIRLSRKLMPDVVLLDLHLPGNGDSEPEYIKTKLLLSAEKIVAMSVSSDDESKALASSYGAVALVDKARLVETLMSTLADMASASLRRREMPFRDAINPL